MILPTEEMGLTACVWRGATLDDLAAKPQMLRVSRSFRFANMAVLRGDIFRVAHNNPSNRSCPRSIDLVRTGSQGVVRLSFTYAKLDIVVELEDGHAAAVNWFELFEVQATVPQPEEVNL